MTTLFFLFLLLSPEGSVIGGGCEDCEAIYQGMPSTIPSRTQIAEKSEKGIPIDLSGTVFRNDSKTPAPNVILYVYQTSAAGIYEPARGATGSARRHGRLRGWVRTNRRGEYRLTTIRPGSYPGRRDPAHIHVIVKEPGKSEYWIDDFLFDDDPLLNRDARRRQQNRGGSGIMRLSRRSDGVWVGTRNLVLGHNVPDYR